VPGRIQRRRRVAPRERASQFGTLDSVNAEGCVHGELHLGNRDRLGLEQVSGAFLCASSASTATVAVRTGVEDGRFSEGELEPSEDTADGRVGTECCGEGDAVAGAVACLVTVDEEGAAVARGVAGVVLIVDGPGGVQLVFVDDDGGLGGDDDGLAFAEEVSEGRGQGVESRLF